MNPATRPLYIIAARVSTSYILLFVRSKRTYMECLKNLYRNISYCVFLRVCVYMCYINRARVSVFVVYKRRDVFDVPIGKCIHILYNHLYIHTVLHIPMQCATTAVNAYYIYILAENKLYISSSYIITLQYNMYKVVRKFLIF